MLLMRITYFIICDSWFNLSLMLIMNSFLVIYYSRMISGSLLNATSMVTNIVLQFIQYYSTCIVIFYYIKSQYCS